MDLIDKIATILKKSGLVKPIIDIHYDNQNNVVGNVADESFKEKPDAEAQQMIWHELKKHLDSEELIRVIALFPETPEERVERLTGHRRKEVKHSNFWYHKTPESTTFWLFIDVAKFGDDYKSFYLIINDKENISKGQIFVYSKEVLDFMELEQNEIYDELYLNTFGNAEAEIKMVLMNHYEKLTNQQLYGKANMYYYVFENFSLKPAGKQQLLFTEPEIVRIKKALQDIDNFTIKKDIENALNKSETFNKLKRSIA
jgi:hypothetical protein